MKEYNTIQETADYLRLSKATIVRYIRRGILKKICLQPRVPRITKEEIEQFIRKGVQTR